MPFGNVYGYTGVNLDGLATLQTGEKGSIDLSGGDVTLTTAECANGLLTVTVGHASNAIIVPAAVASANPGKLYIINNTHATLAALIKVAGGTAITVAALNSAIVRINAAGTQIARVTADTVMT